MIQFANTDTTPLVRSMWSKCFGDTEEYLDLHFSQKYHPENTLLYFDKDIAVAALQMLPYSIRFYGKEIPFYYLAGLCTLPEHRNKGYMRQLIDASFEVMAERKIPICGLMPAEEWLFGYYQKFGFETVSEPSDDIIDLNAILQKSDSLSDAFNQFDSQYQKNDFCVLKTLSDFGSIVTDYENEGRPTKRNLKAMTRIVSAETTLSLYADKNKDKDFVIQMGQDMFELKNGKVGKANLSHFDISVDISFLTRLLFGYHTSELDTKYSSLFEEHHPIINLMLE